MARGAYRYKNPGEGTVYLQCALCERVFRVYRYRQREGAKFCSLACTAAAIRAFYRALVDGRLEGILSEERARAKVASRQRAEAQRLIDRRRAANVGPAVETVYERQVRELGRSL